MPRAPFSLASVEPPRFAGSMHDQIARLLAREPFEPFVVVTADGREIVASSRDQVVLNSLAVSVVEAAFSVTVIGLAQIAEIRPAAPNGA